MLRNGIKIKQHVGTWYIIDEKNHKGKLMYLLEHEQYGDEAACLIVDKEMNLIMENVWNGFEDLDDLDN